MCVCVCGLDLPILADWLSVSNLNLKSEQRDVSRRVAEIRAQLPTKKNRGEKNRDLFYFFYCASFNVCVRVSAKIQSKRRERESAG